MCYRPGEQATLLVARRERLVRLPVTFGAAPRPRFRLEVDPAATPEQRRHLDEWLGAGSPAGQDETPRCEGKGPGSPASGDGS
jgi:hypothetical protein